jgi:hypothetical protein
MVLERLKDGEWSRSSLVAASVCESSNQANQGNYIAPKQVVIQT